MSVEDALYPMLSAYERLPQGVKVGIGWTYRHLPQQVRLGSGYGEFRDLAERAETWSAPEIAEYQLEQLRTVLLHAAKHSPFYAHRFAEAGFHPQQFRRSLCSAVLPGESWRGRAALRSWSRLRPGTAPLYRVGGPAQAR